MRVLIRRLSRENVLWSAETIPWTFGAIRVRKYMAKPRTALIEEWQVIEE